MRFTRLIAGIDWLIVRPIAHRGFHDASQGVIENTASAFAAAMAGDYAIECDLQLTTDGEAVVFHDDTLDRLTSASGMVKSRDIAALKSISFKASSDRIQTLGELLDQVDGRVPLVIEIKSHWDADLALAQRALAVLRGYRGLYALMSFDPKIIEGVRELSPRTVRGIVADRTTDRYYQHMPLGRRLGLRHFSHLARSRPHFISFEAAGLPFAPVSLLRACGLPIISWTIRDRQQADHARRYSDQITFEGFPA